MGNPALHQHLLGAHATDIRECNKAAEGSGAPRDKREDLIVYTRTVPRHSQSSRTTVRGRHSHLPGTLGADPRRPPGCLRALHVVDGGGSFNAARQAASDARRMHKDRNEATTFVSNWVPLKQQQYSEVLLAHSRRDENGDAVDHVVVINDHLSQRPTVKEATNVKHACRRLLKYSDIRLKRKTQEQHREFLDHRAKLLAAGHDYSWTFDDLEPSAAVTGGR
ncbi:hypothetical protein JCM3770_006051 [Rhodotorula araucariae]